MTKLDEFMKSKIKKPKLKAFQANIEEGILNEANRQRKRLRLSWKLWIEYCFIRGIEEATKGLKK